ncbi:tyrosine-protein kinase family protein [Streptomyces bambusae]|nr:ParA family protein [Streptomyces bambusae]
MAEQYSHPEIRSAVLSVLPSADVTVVSDPGGLVVRVVSQDIDGWDEATRKDRVVSVMPPTLADRVYSWEILTPSEAEWYGELSDGQSPVPGWQAALDRASRGDVSEITFASDLDDDLESAPVVTFYSLKGGVGRSTALAAVARKLSGEHGLKVVCIDMDLEAPGLDTLFGIEDRVEPDQGAVSALLQYEFAADCPVLDHVLPVDDSGRLYCMPAGRLGSQYAAQLRSLEPEIWYRERINALHRLIDDVRGSNLRPDVILIDSRTGVSPVAAPLLFDVSDMAVVCFHPHGQARSGTELLTRALLRSTTRRRAERPLTPEPRFVVSPMPPGISATRLAERAKTWVEGWLDPLAAGRHDAPPLSPEEITHVVPYNPDVAFSDTVATSQGQLAPYARIADWILQIVPEPAPERAGQRQSSERKAAALRQLSFSTGTAESLDSADFLQDYVVTRQVNETADPQVPLILGRKGTGKTALFRWLAAGRLEGWTPVLVTTPQLRERPDWSFSPDAYKAVEGVLNAEGLEWGSFWQVLVALAVYRTQELPSELDAPHPAMEHVDDGEFATVRCVAEVLRDPMGPLACGEWLRRFDVAQDSGLLLLFDGLDTAFGHSADARRTRASAISGLLMKQADLAPRLEKVRFKILVRLDIWQGLRFENKSHFFGLSKRLQWEEREEYFKVVLKRAIRADAFRLLLEETDKALVDADVASWSPEQVALAWNALVGERMRGERTAFTANWVWNRLADGNGDHSPRALLQIFAAALKWERDEERRSSYERSVLRPRSLAVSLEEVSEQALSALLDEEFQELQGLASVLRDYGRTPVAEDHLEANLSGVQEDLVGLAQEVGLLAPMESDSSTRLFRVPDLYRWGLGVTRRGPI